MNSNEHFKRFVPMFFVIILAASVFAGCTGDDDDIETIDVKGSTTVLPIAQLAAEQYMEDHDDADITVSGGGSSAGVQAAGEGTADIGMASRDIKQSEMDTYPDLKVFKVARDGIALIINKANNITALTVEEIKGIYNGTYENWKELGGTDKEIVVVGRDSASGTREFFWDHVMDKEEFVEGMLEKNSNGAVHDSVADTEGAIGYVGLGYVDDEIKPVKVTTNDGDIDPTVENVKNEKYPIARSLNMCTLGDPTGLAKEFLDFILSDEGQQIVADEGFVPLN